MEIKSNAMRTKLLREQASYKVASSDMLIISLESEASLSDYSLRRNLSYALKQASKGRLVVVETLVSQSDLRRSYPDLYTPLQGLANVKLLCGSNVPARATIRAAEDLISEAP